MSKCVCAHVCGCALPMATSRNKKHPGLVERTVIWKQCTEGTMLRATDVKHPVHWLLHLSLSLSPWKRATLTARTIPTWRNHVSQRFRSVWVACLDRFLDDSLFLGCGWTGLRTWLLIFFFHNLEMNNMYVTHFGADHPRPQHIRPGKMLSSMHAITIIISFNICYHSSWAAGCFVGSPPLYCL